MQSLVKKLIPYVLPKGPESIKHALFRTSVLNLIARVFGYFKQVAIAVLLGFSMQTDAFFMAVSLIGIFMIFVDVFDSVGVPNLVKAHQRSEEEFKKLAGLLFSFSLTLALLSLIIALISMSFLLKVPKGFSPQAIEYTKIAYLLLLPYLFFSFIFHHFGAVLRSVRRFTSFFIGELLFSFFSFLITLLLLLSTGNWIALPIALSVAQVIACIYMLYAGRNYLHLKLYFDENTKAILKHFVSLSILYGVFHLFILVDRAFASYLGEKSVSALSYGLLLASAPRGVFKLEHMAITSLSENPNMAKLNFFLKKVFVYTPLFSAFFILFSEPITKLFFGYGKFSTLDLKLTATAVFYYSLSLPFMFAWPIIYRHFQVKERLRAIAFVALAGVIANFLANYILVFELKLGIAGICLGTFVAYTVLCGTSYLLAKNVL